MNCCECYYSKLNHGLSKEKICCNQESSNYNRIFQEYECVNCGCDKGVSTEEFDYKNMTAWQFASKYYM